MNHRSHIPGKTVCTSPKTANVPKKGLGGPVRFDQIYCSLYEWNVATGERMHEVNNLFLFFASFSLSPHPSLKLFTFIYDKHR